MNLLVSFSALAELVGRYLLKVINTITEFDLRIGHVQTCLLTLTLTLTLAPAPTLALALALALPLALALFLTETLTLTHVK